MNDADLLKTLPEGSSSVSDVREAFDKLVVQRPRPASRRAQFFEGLAAPMIGLRFVTARKGYIKTFVFPIFVQTLMSVGLILLLLMVGRLLIRWIHTAIMTVVEYVWPTAASESVGQWTDIALYILIALFLLYVFHLVWRITGGIIDDYFGDQITNRVMTDLGIDTVQPANSMARTVVNNAKFVGLSHAVMLVCSPLSVVPVVGSVAVLAAGTTTMLFLKGADELSDPLINLGLSRREAFQLCKRHRWTTMGVAASKAGLEPVPFFGGAISASESIGRIAVAMRLLQLDQSESPNEAE